MRRGRAIAFATALEILSEPFCLLVTLTAIALAVFAPAVHYHQFGEPTRMARDAGFSSLLLGGFFHAAFGSFRTFRREAESGTMATALAHSVSRTQFFLAKFAGCAISYLVFALTVGAVSLTVVRGADIGGRIAAASGDILKIWGPSLSWALAAAVVPVCLSAALNRFARFRFTLTASLLACAVALVGAVYRYDAALAGRILPAAVLFALPPLLVASASSAFACRFQPNLAVALTALSVAPMILALGNYCLSDALARGGSVPAAYFWGAVAAIVPAVGAFLTLGVCLLNGKDAV